MARTTESRGGLHPNIGGEPDVKSGNNKRNSPRTNSYPQVRNILMGRAKTARKSGTKKEHTRGETVQKQQKKVNTKNQFVGSARTTGKKEGKKKNQKRAETKEKEPGEHSGQKKKKTIKTVWSNGGRL